MVRLADPLALLALLALPLLVFVLRRVPGVLARNITHFCAGMLPETRTWRTRLHALVFPLECLSLLFAVVALARPQTLRGTVEDGQRGIDILVVLDVSGSMASVDFKPQNRLEVAKMVIGRFMEGRKNDRMGLVTFAGVSATRCPLTVDHNILLHTLRQARLGDLVDGTAIGMALAHGVGRLRHAAGKSKVIILLTDGVNNRGEVAPKDAAQIAVDFGVKVYTIGVGTRGQAAYPVTDSFGRQRFMMVDVTLDEDLLKDIANRSGGLYFRATDGDSLRRIFAEIDRLETREIRVTRYREWEDVYLWPLGLSVMLLLLSLMLRRLVVPVLP